MSNNNNNTKWLAFVAVTPTVAQHASRLGQGLHWFFIPSASYLDRMTTTVTLQEPHRTKGGRGLQCIFVALTSFFSS
eukprot:1159898-Pelagomonas_calceolata.AAC.4